MWILNNSLCHIRIEKFWLDQRKVSLMRKREKRMVHPVSWKKVEQRSSRVLTKGDTQIENFIWNVKTFIPKEKKNNPVLQHRAMHPHFFSYSLWNLYSSLVWHRSSENEIECEIFCCCCCCLIPLHESCPLAKRKQANTFVVGVDSVGSVMRKWKISFIETVLFRELFDLFSEFLAFTNHTLIIDVWNIRCM